MLRFSVAKAEKVAERKQREHFYQCLGEFKPAGENMQQDQGALYSLVRTEEKAKESEGPYRWKAFLETWTACAKVLQ